MVSPRQMSGAAEIERQAERQQLMSSVSNLVGGLNIRLDRITIQMVDLSRSLQTVSASVTQNSFLERQKEAIEQERERRVAEQQLREGQEALVERKIENATVAPAQKAAVKAQSSLSRLMGFFTLLLTGWLAPKVIGGIISAAKFTTDALNAVKTQVGKGFNLAGNVFKNIYTGLANIVGSITRTTSRISQAIANGLFKYPFQVVRNAAQGTIDKIRNIVRPGSANPPSAAPPPTSGSPANNIFNTIRRFSGMLTNPFAQGTVGTAANVASGVPFGPALVGAAFGIGGIGMAGKALNFLPAPFKIPAMIGLGILGYQPLNKMGQNIAGNFSNVMNFNLFSNNDQASTTTSDAAASIKANVQTAPTPSLVRAQNLGPAPEPETTVVVTAGQQQQPRDVPTNMNPFANSIPSISSSNPDNFYVYYSMANYNVVA
jgi:hypothetical protein